MICKGIHKYRRPTAISVVTEVSAHAGKGVAVLVVGQSGEQGDLRERAIAVIAEELLRDGVISDKNVRPAVTVKIVDCDPQTFSRRARNTALLRYIRESPVAVIVKHEMSDRLKLIGMAIRAIAGTVFPAENVQIEIPLHIASNDQIKPAVAVIIDEAGAGAPCTAADARLVGDVGKSSISVVMVKNVSAKVRHQKINVAVVIVITAGDPHAVQVPL